MLMRTPYLETLAANDTACLPWTRRHFWLAIGAVFGFWALAASLWPLTGTVVPWDSKNHFYPMLRYLGAALANGELPLWNPYHFSGHPSVADPQSLLFTPTMLLFGWLVPSPSMQVFDLVVFAHFLPGAFGIIAFFRKRRWHAAGAVMAAMIFILGGSASGRLQHTGMILSYGFYPLALALLDEAMDRRSWMFGAAFALCAAMMTIGRDQVAFLCAITLIGFVFYKISIARHPLSYAKDRLALLFGIGIVGAGLLVVPVLLTMQFVKTSTRPAFGYGVAAMGSLPPSSLVTLFFGNVFGSLRWTYDYWGPDWNSITEGTWTDRATNYLFAGTLPALLLPWHGIAGGRLLAREFRFFLIGGIVAVIYALGRYTPVFEWIFDTFPAIDLYRRPADATFLINIFMAYAAGFLVHRYILEGVPRFTSFRRSALLTALSCVSILAAIVCAWRFAASVHQIPSALGEIALGMALAVGAAFLLHRSCFAPRMRLVTASFLVLCTGGELMWRNAASPLNAEPAERYAVFRELPPEQLQGLQVLKSELETRHAKGERPRVEILGISGAWQNASMVLGLEDTIGYNPLRLADYEKAVGPGENAADPNLRQFPGMFRGYRCRMASLLGLEYLVMDRPQAQWPRHFPRMKNAQLLYGSGTMWVYRLPPSAPRAYLATRLIPVDSEEALAREELPEFDRQDEALIDRGSIPGISGDYGLRDGATNPDAPNASVLIRGYRRNAVTIEVDTDRAGILILHDIYYPGWEATMDGEHKPILRTNLLFRGIEVSAGHHIVEFTFNPLSVANLISAAGGLMERSDETTTQDPAK